MKIIKIKTTKKNELVDITSKVEEIISKSSLGKGFCILYCPHTTAGIIINEGADPSVKEDILNKLSELVPESPDYKHAEGNSDSHIKSSLVGISKIIPFESGKLSLGTWQSIFFAEFDGPRNRTLETGLIKQI